MASNESGFYSACKSGDLKAVQGALDAIGPSEIKQLLSFRNKNDYECTPLYARLNCLSQGSFQLSNHSLTLMMLKKRRKPHFFSKAVHDEEPVQYGRPKGMNIMDHPFEPVGDNYFDQGLEVVDFGDDNSSISHR
mmetsp:Transcript_30159/g.38742  ORF Transcript_30159/g.38742 Transcript_30159/m.38742 type:complete len:135 (+) Transcript_30159:134-538(+)